MVVVMVVVLVVSRAVVVAVGLSILWAQRLPTSL